MGYLGSNAWRRVGCPLVMALAFLGLHGHLLAVAISGGLQYGAMSIGYGTPSTQPPDAGSWLGRKFGENTRLVWFGILALAMIPLFL